MKIKVKTGFFSSRNCNIFIEKNGFRVTDETDKETYIPLSFLSELYITEGGGQSSRFSVMLDGIAYEGTFEDAGEAHQFAWTLCHCLNGRINMELKPDDTITSANVLAKEELQ